MNASVFLAAMLLDEPIEIGEPAAGLIADVMGGSLVAHVPDRFEDEVLAGIVEAISKGCPLIATPDGVF